MFNRSKRSDGRSGTNSWFKTRFTKPELPSAPTKVKIDTEVRPAPTYAHADKQTGPVDNTAEQREHEDESIREEKGKNKKDPEQAITDLAPPSRKVVQNERHDGPSTDSAPKVPAVYNRFWKLELEYDLEEEIEFEFNYWTPNALALFEILRASGKYVYDNATVLKRHADYLDYAVACYYSIIFYIQILRAQKAAGKLRGPDRSFFNRFKDRFPFEELPVSSIFEPYLSTIVSVLPKDGKYDWIIPDYSTDVFRARFDGAFTPAHGACFIQPMVPYMLRILRTSITSARITDVQAHSDRYFNDDDNYVSRTLNATTPRTLFGANYQQNHATTDDRNTLFAACGVSYPYFADITQLTNAAPKMRRSKFKGFPYGVAADAAANLAIDSGAAIPITEGSLDYFLHMEKTADVDWFLELVRQAALHARFFEGVTNLSNIPTTSGNEPLISCRFKKIVNRTEVTHANVQLGLRTAAADTPDWYPDTFRGYVGSFYTTREGTERSEALQAFTNGTNGTIAVTYQAAAGTEPAYNVGEGPRFRRGPYWSNKEWAATKFKDSGINGKPMFRGWETMFQDDAALEKPTGY
nr:capsid protein [Sarcosphaera coronaria partitivirus]